MELLGRQTTLPRAVSAPGHLLRGPGTQGPLGGRPVVPSSPLFPVHVIVTHLQRRSKPVGTTQERTRLCASALRTRRFGSVSSPTHAAHELVKKTVRAEGLFADFCCK